MILTRAHKIAIASGAVVVAFAAGRYTTTSKVKIETKTVEVEKVVYRKDADTTEKKNVNTVIKEVTHTDGTKEIVTTTTDTSVSTEVAKETSDTDIKKSSDETKEITKGQSKLQIEALAGLDLNTGKVVYGGEISRPIIGPVTIGAFGLSDGTAGITVGIQF